MNLERILAENLLRFNAKNLNKQLFTYKYLLEQTDSEKQAEMMDLLRTQGENYLLFQNWQQKINEQYGTVLLVKSQEFVPINPTEITLKDEFYNNFVTLETGVKDPETLKANLDKMIDDLKNLGANLYDKKTVIEIVSTASKPAAGAGPNPSDFPKSVVPASHKKLDHDYGGNLKYDAAGKPTAESKQWARDNGNAYLAKARGESVKKYLESKNIKATIIIKALIDQEFREFRITAKQEGTQKVIMPIGTPDLDWSFSYSANLSVAYDQEFLKDTTDWKREIDAAYEEIEHNAQRDYTEGNKPGVDSRVKYPDPQKFPDQKSDAWRLEYKKLNLSQYLKGTMLTWALYGTPSGCIYLNVGGSWSFGNSTGKLPKVSAKLMSVVGNKPNGILTAIKNASGPDIWTMREPGTDAKDIEANYAGMKKEMFQTFIASSGVDTGNQSSGDFVDRGVKGVIGIPESERLNSSGCTNNGHMIYAQFKNAASPLITQLTGTDVAAWLKSVNDLALSDNIYSKSGHMSWYYDSLKTDFDPLLSMTVSAGATGKLKDLLKAAIAAGISDTFETPQTDPAYWNDAYFIDFTKMDNNGFPNRGKLNRQTAADFFKDTEFAK